MRELGYTNWEAAESVGESMKSQLGEVAQEKGLGLEKVVGRGCIALGMTDFKALIT